MIDGRLKHFAMNYADDDSLWWQLEEGEMKNLFDAALEEIAALRDQERQWQSIVGVYKRALAYYQSINTVAVTSPVDEGVTA